MTADIEHYADAERVIDELLLEQGDHPTGQTFTRRLRSVVYGLLDAEQMKARQAIEFIANDYRESEARLTAELTDARAKVAEAPHWEDVNDEWSRTCICGEEYCWIEPPVEQPAEPAKLHVTGHNTFGRIVERIGELDATVPASNQPDEPAKVERDPYERAWAAEAAQNICTQCGGPLTLGGSCEACHAVEPKEKTRLTPREMERALELSRAQIFELRDALRALVKETDTSGDHESQAYADAVDLLGRDEEPSK